MRRLTWLAFAALSVGCSDNGATAEDTGALEAKVVRQYAVNLGANYKEVIVALEALKVATDAFVAAPSAEGLARTQQAWLAARPAYGQCEVSRFYGGPLDDLQGGMNEWPIDENFIDYTAGNPQGGLINDPERFPSLDRAALRGAASGTIENAPTGFHAIEFALWGQRPDQSGGPGERPYTDYGDGGTAANQDRRRQYLQAIVDVLLSDMRELEVAWDLQTSTSYGARFVSGSAHDGIEKLVRGFTNMAITELLYERLMDPYLTRDRKDEESCFSESTSVDLVANMLGVENVYLGRYAASQGASVSDLVKQKDPALDAALRSRISAARAAIDAIPVPFDHAVIAPETSADNMKVRAAIDALLPLQKQFRELGTALSITLNL